MFKRSQSCIGRTGHSHIPVTNWSANRRQLIVSITIESTKISPRRQAGLSRFKLLPKRAPHPQAGLSLFGTIEMMVYPGNAQRRTSRI
jgi:hypothetical protein